MKKYKLIKEYLESPKLGTIVSKSNSYPHYNYNGGDYTTSIIQYFVENTPEFWEEVRELEFQILEAKTSVKVSLTAENTSTEIYKVLRLLDNEIFSIGDKCNLRNGNGYRNPILRFEIRNENFGLEQYRNKDRVVAFLETMHKTEWGPIELDSLVKSEEPLFITEDKVKIFKGDLYFYVDDYFDIVGMRTGITSGTNGFKYFSTEKAAKDWIHLNKPKYSLKDIMNACLNNTKDCEYAMLSFLRLYK